MLYDAWLDARGHLLDWAGRHGDAVLIAIIVLVVAVFAWRWFDAR